MQIRLKPVIQNRNLSNSQTNRKIMMQLLKDQGLRLSRKKRKKQKQKETKFNHRNLQNLLLKYFTKKKISSIQKKFNNKMFLMIL